MLPEERDAAYLWDMLQAAREVDSMMENHDLPVFLGDRVLVLALERGIEIIGEVLEKAGAGLQDVVRTRMFVTDIDRWEEVGRAHREAFGEIMPATTMVEVSRLIDPAMLVEIEADAVVCADDG